MSFHVNDPDDAKNYFSGATSAGEAGAAATGAVSAALAGVAAAAGAGAASSFFAVEANRAGSLWTLPAFA
jgi:hypothetical protein